MGPNVLLTADQAVWQAREAEDMGEEGEGVEEVGGQRLGKQAERRRGRAAQKQEEGPLYLSLSLCLPLDIVTQEHHIS